MPAEAWLVLTLAASWLLLGVAGILMWAVYRRNSQAGQNMEERWRKLADEVRGLERRTTELEAVEPADTRTRGRGKSPSLLGARGSIRADSSSETRLIAVPSLEASLNERDVSVSGLKERHAAIWSLADTGATPEVIARATGQPIGQIELVLGLRRQIDATRTNFSHVPHA